MSEKVSIPWIDEPVELPEAVEIVAKAGEDDEEAIENLTERIDRLQQRLASHEDATSIECPSCGTTETVYKAGVGAAKLASQGVLSDANAEALNSESHVCLDCRESFTPRFD